jgi:hypothetical protein
MSALTLMEKGGLLAGPCVGSPRFSNAGRFQALGLGGSISVDGVQ